MSEELIPFDDDGEEPVIPFDVSEIQAATVELTVPTPSLEVGTVGSAFAIVRGVGGVRLPSRTVTWSSSNDTVIADPAASVTGQDGRATVSLPALAEGAASLTATCEGVDSAGTTIAVFAVAPNPGYSTSGSAKVVVNCSSIMKLASRAQPRRFSDADQRRIDPTDTAFSRVKDGQEREIVWPNRELLRSFG